MANQQVPKNGGKINGGKINSGKINVYQSRHDIINSRLPTKHIQIIQNSLTDLMSSPDSSKSTF